jgi:hypothetical protein
MTPDHLAAIQAFAKGPLDGYTIHTAQQAIPALLAELERLRFENATLTARVEVLNQGLDLRDRAIRAAHDLLEDCAAGVKKFNKYLEDGCP